MNNLTLRTTTLLLLVTIFLTQNSIAQDFATGLLLVEDNETPTISTLGTKFQTFETVVDLRPYAPTAGNQGRVSSCVGWSVGYAALTIMYAQQEKWQNKQEITENAFSPHFIYNQVARFKDSNCKIGGAYFSSALKLLMEQGTCKKTSFPLPPSTCDIPPKYDQRTEAVNFRIKDYLQLFKKDDKEALKIQRIKKSLTEKIPVVVGMMLDDEFKKIKPGDKYWKPSSESKYGEGHAMVVVGYHAIKKEITLMNSWGPEWGDNGFITIKMKDFAPRCVLAYQILLAEEGEELPEVVITNDATDNVEDGKITKPTLNISTNLKPGKRIILKGDFAFRYPVDWDDEKQEPIFENAEVEKQGDYYYSLVNTEWEIGQQFQLMANNIRQNRYVYVFSMDGEGTMRLHFPKMEEKEVTTKDGEVVSAFGFVESPLVPYKSADILIPGEGKAFEKNLEGDDHLFVLYSYYELTDIREIMKNIEDSDLPYEKRLPIALGERLIPMTDIDFKEDTMKALAKSNKGTVLGFMLESKEY